MEGTDGARLDTIALTPMRPHNYRRINVLERGQRVHEHSGNPNKSQEFVTENHGVGSSILPLGIFLRLGTPPLRPLRALNFGL